jgi:hypothetical protein
MHLLPADHLSSLAFTQGDFRPHGEFLCWMEDGLLMWESRGPFNLEALQAFGRTRQAAFARWGLDDRPLAAVMRWVGSALMSPEAFALYERSFEAFIASHHRYVAVAWVGGPEVEGLDLMRARYAPLFERHGLAFAVFADLDAAREWARPQLQAARKAASAPD